MVTGLICAALSGIALFANGVEAIENKGRELFRQAIEILAAKPLGCDRVDWAVVQNELEKTIPSGASESDAYQAIDAAVKKLKDTHARFIPALRLESPSNKTEDSSASSATNSTRGEIPVQPQGVLLDDRTAYVVVPMCGATELSELRQYASLLRKVIASLEAQNPRGWVIDLRFNGGGNVWPMLLGLRPVLGDGTLTTSLVNGKVSSHVGCDNAAVWLEYGDKPVGAKQEQLRIELEANDRMIAPSRVAVLIGPWTMSSGELAVLAFRGRENTRFFGQSSAGLTTVTDYFVLRDGSILNLPISHMADRNGSAPLGPIKPDQLVDSSAWPSADDEVARMARNWVGADRK